MAQENTNATEGYQMKTGWGTIAMLISATGMGLVPLFSRWATRTDMFDGTLGLNAGDSIGALMACGRMGMGVLFFVILMVATHKVKTFKELKLTPAIALGGLMIGMSLACYVTSTLLTTVANAVLFIYTGPVICVLAARIFRKEPMSGLQWICLLVVFIGMLFGEGLLGFGVGGQFFGLDFSLETSTPEFPQKGVGDAFGLLSGLFYGLSMFFNGYRKDADTTARGVWNFIFAVIGEELGLVGALFVIGLFFCVLYAGLAIAERASDDIGAMIAAACIRNLGEYGGKFTVYMGEINDIGGICLSLFLGMAMITLKIWQLAELALPLVVLLAGQTLFMILYSFAIVYNVMGRDYDAAVIVSGTCGFGMGATPNAMANMQAVCDKYSPSVKAYLLIPLVGSLFADFINSLVITVFINFI